MRTHCTSSFIFWHNIKVCQIVINITTKSLLLKTLIKSFWCFSLLNWYKYQSLLSCHSQVLLTSLFLHLFSTWSGGKTFLKMLKWPLYPLNPYWDKTLWMLDWHLSQYVCSKCHMHLHRWPVAQFERKFKCNVYIFKSPRWILHTCELYIYVTFTKYFLNPET